MQAIQHKGLGAWEYDMGALIIYSATRTYLLLCVCD